MEILDKIKNQLKEAQKNGDIIGIETLRLLLSEIHNYEIKKRVEDKEENLITEEEILEIIQREIKKRNESLDFFRKAKRDDLIERTEAELNILSFYAPKLLNEDEISIIVDDLIKQGISEFNLLMKEIMQKYKGKIDGNLASKIIKQKLN